MWGVSEQIRVELMESDIVPDCIVVGGPSISMIRHGPCNQRGFGPEKRTGLREEGGGWRRSAQAGVPSD